jgi:hypothetical protein
MVSAAGVVGYNSWAGHRWIRFGGLVCLGIVGLSFLLTWWFSLAMIPLVVGVGLLWHPGVTRFFDEMEGFREKPVIQVPVFGIRYGPQPLIGSRDCTNDQDIEQMTNSE